MIRCKGVVCVNTHVRMDTGGCNYLNTEFCLRELKKSDGKEAINKTITTH